MSEVGDQRKDGFSRTFDEGGKVQIGHTFPFLISLCFQHPGRITLKDIKRLQKMAED